MKKVQENFQNFKGVSEMRPPLVPLGIALFKGWGGVN